MANEITKTISFKTTKNGGVDSANGASAAKQITQTGNYSSKFAQNITQAADVALAVPSNITYPAHLMVENLDGTNYLELSTGTGGAFAGGKFSRVPPLDRVVIVAPAAIYGKANTADCKATVTVAEV